MSLSHRSIAFRLGIAVAAASLPYTAAQAQTPALERGSLLVGGSASFNVQDVSDDDDNTTTFALLPSVLYFVQPGLAVGGELQFQRISREDFSTTSYGIGPALAYYFVQDSNVHPFLRGSVRIARTTSESGGQDFTANLFGFRAAAGLLFLLSESVGIDASAYFDRLQYSADLDGDVSNYGIAFGVSAFVF